jgi:hypothetical protein
MPNHNIIHDSNPPKEEALTKHKDDDGHHGAIPYTDYKGAKDPFA